jgi:cell division protein FtsA
VEDIIVGIDIGTTKVCTLIGRIDKTGQLQVLGKGFTPFNGVKKGVIVDIEDTSKAIRFSKEEAEDSASLNFSSAYINIYGTHVNVLNHKESINISSENQVITSDDLNRLYDAIEMLPIPEGSQIIDIVPREYIIDGYGGILDPIGMSGLTLEIDVDVVTGKLTSVQNITIIGIVSIFSYVVNLLEQFKHSRLLLIVIPSSICLESITLSSSKLQNGHFISESSLSNNSYFK